MVGRRLGAPRGSGIPEAVEVCPAGRDGADEEKQRGTPSADRALDGEGGGED